MLSFKKRFLRIPKFVHYILNTFVASSLVQLNSEYTLMKFHSEKKTLKGGNKCLEFQVVKLIFDNPTAFYLLISVITRL